MKKQKQKFQTAEDFEQKYGTQVALAYKPRIPASERPQIMASECVADFIRPFFGERIELREEFYVILTNRVNRVLAVKQMSIGSVGECVANEMCIFQHAILYNATGIILAHNHPSGSLKPSNSDRELTKKVRQGALLLGMNLLDSMIIVSDGYYSLADNGEL